MAKPPLLESGCHCSYALSPEMSRPPARLVRMGVEIGHEGEFGLGAGAPSEVELCHEVAEVFAGEDHAVEDAVHEGLHGVGGEGEGEARRSEADRKRSGVKE